MSDERPKPGFTKQRQDRDVSEKVSRSRASISNEVMNIDHPGMFASADKLVINWDGEQYYKSCGAFVSKVGDGGESSCVKREGHPGTVHEDFDGRTKDEWDFGFGILSLEEAVGQAVGAASACWDNLEGAGVFQSTRAKAIVEQLMDRIKMSWPADD
jgi:hypothetical protein